MKPLMGKIQHLLHKIGATKHLELRCSLLKSLAALWQPFLHHCNLLNLPQHQLLNGP